MFSNNISSPRVWFVTGASSGLGLAMTEHALSKGDIVVATLRKPEVLREFAKKYSKEKLFLVQLDVTHLEDITAAFSKAKEVFGRIDIVLNNAGYGLLGEVESTALQLVQDQFNVCFWGALHVAREAVRVMREDNVPNGGKILNISSSAALDTWASFGYYTAARLALVGVMETLPQELSPAWNIKVTTILLGSFKTRSTTTDSMVFAPVDPIYDNPSLLSHQTRSIFTGVGSFPGASNINKGARQIYKLSTLDELPVLFPLGKLAIAGAVKKGNIYLDMAKKWESWSEDLDFDDSPAA